MVQQLNILHKKECTVLDYVHMYVTNVRFANAIFWLTLISIGVFTCIRLRFALSHIRFAGAIFSVAENIENIAFGRKFALISIVELDIDLHRNRGKILLAANLNLMSYIVGHMCT